MAVNKFISSKYIHAKVFRDFSISTNSWVADGYEWIGEVLEEVGSSYTMRTKRSKIEVCNHNGIVPSCFQTIDFVFLCCEPLPLNNDVACVPCESKSSERWYRLNGGSLEFPFETSTDVEIVGQALLVDDDGYPLVPDNVHFKNAAAFYILSKLILNGYKHPVLGYSDAYSLFSTALIRAQNSLKMPSLGQMEKFKNNWISYVRDIHAFAHKMNTSRDYYINL